MTRRLKIKHRQNTTLVNIAKKNHPTDKTLLLDERDGVQLLCEERRNSYAVMYLW